MLVLNLSMNESEPNMTRFFWRKLLTPLVINLLEYTQVSSPLGNFLTSHYSGAFLYAHSTLYTPVF